MRFALLVLVLPLLLAACDDVRHEGKTPREWAEALAASEKFQRPEIVEALSTHLWPYATSAIPPLVAALEHEDADVRQLAAQCLGRIGKAARGEPAAALAQHLEDPAGHVACAAAEALGEVGDAAAIAPLTAVLGGDDAKRRACAARALGAFGPAARAAAEALKTGVDEDEDARARLHAALALARVTGDVDASRPTIAAALSPPSGPTSRERIYVREEAIRHVGKLGPLAAEFVPAVIEVVKADRSFARDFAAGTLARLGPVGRAGIPALIEGLDDATFRQAAAKALGEFGADAKAAVPKLVALLRRPTWKEGATVAATAIGQIGPDADAAVPALVEALGNRDPRVQEAVLVAIGRIGPRARQAESAIAPLREAPQGFLRAAALRAGAQVASPATEGDTREKLLELTTKSEDADTRRAAAEALVVLAADHTEVRTALEALERTDPSAAVRRAAAAVNR